MSTGSTVSVALAALTAKFASVTTGLSVVDGPDYDTPDDSLCVGWDRSDQPAVQLTRVHADVAGNRRQETYEVSCLLSIQDGEGTVASVRDTAYAALGSCDTALSADPRLAGAVLLAELTNHEYTPTLVETGAACDLRFTVRVTAMK